MNIRTYIAYNPNDPNLQGVSNDGMVLSVKQGAYMDFPSLAEFNSYVAANNEIAVRILPGLWFYNQDVLNLLHQFDYTTYQWGIQTAIAELAEEQAAINLGLPVPTFVQVESSPGVIGGTTLDTSSGIGGELLAGMNPYVIGGLVLGAIYMFFGKKGGKGGSISGSPGGKWL